MVAQADKALNRSKARGEIRKTLIETGAESQKQISQTRGQERRQTATHVTSERIRERNASEAARIQSRRTQAQIAEQTMQSRRVQRVQTQEELNAVRNRQRLIVGTQRTVANTSIWSTVVMVFFLTFGMIVLYILVTNGEKFGALASGIGNFIHGISTNTPLFVAVPKTDKPSITVTPNSSSGGGYGGGSSSGGGGGGSSIT